jgi:hypothetical protein
LAVACPLVFVRPVTTVLRPSGAVILNVTEAEPTGVPPLVTTAARCAVVPRLYDPWSLDTAIASEPAVTVTVAAEEAPLARPFSVAVNDTGYEPAVAEAGAVTCNVPDALAPGLRLSDEPLDILAVQPEGTLGDSVKVEAPHAAPLRLVIETARLAVTPAPTEADATVISGAAAVQTGAVA